jgi:signal transduction histidine kinase
MKLSTRIILAFSVVIILSIADSYTNYLLSIKVEENTAFLAHSEDIIRNSNDSHRKMLGMQSAFRGFLLTSDTSFLTPFNVGLSEVPQMLAIQKFQVADDPEQLKILDSIQHLHELWLTYARQLIRLNLRSKSSDSSAIQFNYAIESQFKKQVGKILNDEITTQFALLNSREYTTRDLHRKQLTASIQRTHLTSIIFLVMTILVGMISSLYIIAIIVRRISSMVRQAEEISKGEFTLVKVSGNDEITSLSQSLNAMSQQLNKNIVELQLRNSELNKYAYVVSHDLKAPVRGIHNVITWIEEDNAHELTPELKNYLRIISDRTRRMEDLINGLLNYARISEPTPEENVDVNIMLKELIEILVPRHFQVNIQPMPVILTERLKLEQVFSNLISNAVKYNHSEQPTLTIEVRTLHRKYEFSVTDNGIGIDKEYHQKIFDIFQTLRRQDETESTGIGLSIVKKIIDEQHGLIAVRSAEGQGSTFTFTWPRNRP